MTRLDCRRVISGVLLVALMALSACGNEGTTERSKAIAADVGSFAKRIAGKKAPVAPSVTAEELEANALVAFPDVPLLFMMRYSTKDMAVASLYGRNGPVDTWISRDLKSVSLERGVLTATRGFGFDLMSMEDGGAVRLLTARADGKAQKTYRFLNGEDQTTRFIVSCDIRKSGREAVETGGVSRDTTIMKEVCRNAPFQVTNTYWVDETGRIVQSIQWGGARNGMFIFRHLRF